MALLLALVLTGVILAFVGDLEEKIRSPLLDSLEKYDPDSNNNADEALVNAWDDFQLEYECCGVDSYRDWQKYNDFYDDNPLGWKVPESCCDPSQNEVRIPISNKSSL